MDYAYHRSSFTFIGTDQDKVWSFSSSCDGKPRADVGLGVSARGDAKRWGKACGESLFSYQVGRRSVDFDTPILVNGKHWTSDARKPSEIFGMRAALKGATDAQQTDNTFYVDQQAF